jgi:alanyl aminopeptidase
MPFRGAILVSLQIVSASAAVPPTLRLDDSVRPARYEAELTLATDATTNSGAIDIDVELARPLSLVWLNAVHLAIREADVRAGGKTLPATVEPGDRNFVGLRVLGVIPAGPARLHIRYEGKISTRDTAGLFQGREGGETYLYTQFESLDAQRAFPCFDQPNFKTPWQLTLHVPEARVEAQRADVAQFLAAE